MKIAVEGCVHGHLDDIYATLQHLERVENVNIDLLICCGDFQAIRNEDDMESLACPPKYRSMNSFWKYYAGIERAPYPTIFVGGNHEASNYLWDLYYGGFVAPNIYFLGFAGVVKFGGVRIAGLSGIYKEGDYHKGHFERYPYNPNDLRSVYHVREYDVNKLLQLQGAIDIFVSHDWPRSIVKHAPKRDVEQLLRHKPFFQKEVEQDMLGSTPGKELLHKLKPDYWFSAHLHTKFAAVVHHPNRKETKFLALDKCLPRRKFLQVFDIADTNGPLEFTYDEDWLAITRAHHPQMPLGRRPAQRDLVELEPHRLWVQKRLAEKGSTIPTKFIQTAPPYEPNKPGGRVAKFSGHVRNPQTVTFLELLDLPYLLDREPQSAPWQQQALSQDAADPDEIPLDDEDAEDAEEKAVIPDDIDELEASRDPDELH